MEYTSACILATLFESCADLAGDVVVAPDATLLDRQLNLLELVRLWSPLELLPPSSRHAVVAYHRRLNSRERGWKRFSAAINQGWPLTQSSILLTFPNQGSVRKQARFALIIFRQCSGTSSVPSLANLTVLGFSVVPEATHEAS